VACPIDDERSVTKRAEDWQRQNRKLLSVEGRGAYLNDGLT
jgi:hypothetical protein